MHSAGEHGFSYTGAFNYGNKYKVRADAVRKSGFNHLVTVNYFPCYFQVKAIKEWSLECSTLTEDILFIICCLKNSTYL